MLELVYAAAFLAMVLFLSVVTTLIYSQFEDTSKEPQVACPKCRKNMVYAKYRWTCPYCGKIIR